MSNSAAEAPPHKKRKTPSSPSSSPLSSLPDELTLSCLARVSRSDQTALSRVSKTCRSLMASPELYKTRSLLRCTENCLYVCLLTPSDRAPRWFILLRRPGGNRFLSPIPSFQSQAPEASSVVAMDRGIYVIGGLVKGNSTSDVLLLDCRTHTWSKLPSMGVARSAAAAGVVGGKIYVFGGCVDPDSSNWGEVFDPKTQTWDSLIPMPDRKTRCQYIHNSVVVRDEKVYAVDVMDKTFYYSPSEEGKWREGNHVQVRGNRRDWCLIDKFIYCCNPRGRLLWCELEQLERQPKGEEEGMYWRTVKGLESLEKSLTNSRLVHFDGKVEALWGFHKIGYGRTEKLIDLFPGCRLSRSGPNVVLFWDVVIEEGDRRRLEIWCAEISMERREGHEIWGNIEWSNVVMTVDPFSHHCKVLHSVSVNL